MKAAHIIGGEMTYACLGNSTYRITIKLYRDAAGGGADFDGAANNMDIPSASITIFRGASFLETKNVSSPSIQSVPLNVNNPCLIVPPGISVQEGIYTFDVQLPNSNESYTISYQRCCRNNTITNILNPGDAGATYTVEITPEAQQSCNSSPAFNNLPPIVICAGSDIDFDFSATDPDGDDLVYELCAPFNGGGNDTQNPEAPFGVAPNPDTPPPYSTITFGTGYDPTFPLGPDANMTINSTTGVINGIPTIEGQFAVGICVSEYRNGTLLSQVRRDFQFNVTSCEPTVVADIEESELLPDGTFRVISCGEDNILFNNQSYQQQFIDDYFWNFYINEDTLTFDEWEPMVQFPSSGTFSGRLVLNEGTDCEDIANIQVEIYPDLNANFEFEYDTCIYSPTSFADLSVSDAGVDAINQWLWNFGDGLTDTIQNPSHLFAMAGRFDIMLTVKDTNDCQKTISKPINYYPVPTTIDINPTANTVCVPFDVTFENNSIPVDSSYTVVWDFGDNSTGNTVSPTHTYSEPGLYDVSIEITSPMGCYTDTLFMDYINALPSPTAAFSYLPVQPNNFEPTVDFINESIDAIAFDWAIDTTVYQSNNQNITYTFPDTGFHTVQLAVTHESGCTDTTIQIIDVEPQVRYFLPNAFTPNYDALNDKFRGAGVMEGSTQFQLEIWNRYGELLFQTNDPLESWNGKRRNAGGDAPKGVYVVIVNYVNPRGKEVQIKKNIMLVR